MDEQHVREIIREELAAHKEQLIKAFREAFHQDAADFLEASDGILHGTSE
jgi:hypothetical protein